MRGMMSRRSLFATVAATASTVPWRCSKRTSSMPTSAPAARRRRSGCGWHRRRDRGGAEHVYTLRVDTWRWMARRCGWIALLAIGAATQMPSIARAVAYARGDSPTWVEVCSAQGSRLVALTADAETAAPDAPAAVHEPLDHCPWCSLSAHAALPPAAPAAWTPLRGLSERVPERFLSAARTPHPWAAARPRGPPAA
ncbi:MAG: DUF2946 domain-containing protein [Rubrivivax sp.]|nr:DUF2946 domain-containing protein [Rubrivivax sp.]